VLDKMLHYCHGLTWQLAALAPDRHLPATRIMQPLTHPSHPQWDGKENGLKVKWIRWGQDRLVRQQKKE